MPALGLAAVTLLTVTSCADGGASGDTAGGGEAAGEPVAVATTTQLGSVLADVTACAGTGSTTLMGPGDDPHDFSPSSRQVAEMAGAELVVANGLGLESGMASALENATADGARVLEVAPELDPLPYAEEPSEELTGEHAGETAEEHAAHADEAEDAHAGETAEEHAAHADEAEDAHAGETAEEHAAHADEAEDAHAGETAEEHAAHGDEDPHVWMDVARMARAAEVIGDALAEATGDDAYADCGRQERSALEEADGQIREILAGIPEDRRTLLTDHDAYAYFADAYGFEVAGVVVPGGSTDSEPSSERLAGLVDRVEREGVDALVMSAGSGNRLIPALAAETGGGVPVVELYEGGVGGPGSGAEDYAEAMVTNAKTLADALS
ncbi:zinc ABC transporter substrate-binding protein [Citricoccus sp. SGAir0253]|nr:zinc ABC transporter substrate-binding protein [Citricoccus sp. SGAir0253]